MKLSSERAVRPYPTLAISNIAECCYLCILLLIPDYFNQHSVQKTPRPERTAG